MQQNKKTTISRFLPWTVIFSLIFVYFAGVFLQKKSESEILDKFAQNYTVIENNTDYLIVQNPNFKHITFGKANGYSGEIHLATYIDSLGKIKKLEVLSQSEGQYYFDKIIKNNFLNKIINDEGQVNTDVDAVTGATYTSDGIKNALIDSYNKVSNSKIASSEKEVVLGFLEIAFVAFAVVVLILDNLKFQHKNHLRWLIIIISVVIFGFIYNSQLTISKIASFLLLNFGDWQSNLYWILLFVFIFAPILFTNKKFYCNWICPFGGAQDCLGYLGKAKAFNAKLTKKARILRSVLTFQAIFMALLLQNPGMASYEIYSGFFSMSISTLGMVVMAIIIVLSLFVKRPWCNFLCPVGESISFLNSLKRK